MKIIIGSDHGGYDLKQTLHQYLQDKGIEVFDCGTDSATVSVSYVQYGHEVARRVAAGEGDFGIVVCGTGIGISIVANKVGGIRCALCHNEFMARMAREHNNANMLALGGRVLGTNLALSILEAFLEADFAGDRHAIRVNQISAIERSEKNV